jgi:carbon-monoxide dehydrogenase medium subunit/xanthine dehydrogenase FAD-binding subunit
MQNFQFYSAKSLEDGLNYISDQGGRSKIIAGGTDLILDLREEKITPDSILNILEIEQLRGITETDDAVRIGPTTTFTEMIQSEVLNQHLPLLVQAASSVGGPQIRNRGTIGGNIATNGPCADVLPAVLALEGSLELQSKKKDIRRVPLEKILLSPHKTAIEPDEIITTIFIRKLAPGTRSGFEKLARRNAMAKGRMNISIILGLDKQKVISELRIVPGAVMPVAQRIEAAEKMLLGKIPDESLIDAAADTLAEKAFKIAGIRWSTEYKEPVLKSVFKRVLQKLL